MLTKGCCCSRGGGHTERAKGFSSIHQSAWRNYETDQSQGPTGPCSSGEDWCALRGTISLRHSDIRSVSVRRRRSTVTSRTRNDLRQTSFFETVFFYGSLNSRQSLRININEVFTIIKLKDVPIIANLIIFSIDRQLTLREKTWTIGAFFFYRSAQLFFVSCLPKRNGIAPIDRSTWDRRARSLSREKSFAVLDLEKRPNVGTTNETESYDGLPGRVQDDLRGYASSCHQHADQHPHAIPSSEV